MFVVIIYSQGRNRFGISNLSIPKSADATVSPPSFVSIHLDSTLEVEPIAFTHMWDTLTVGVNFSCRIVQLSTPEEKESTRTHSRNVKFQLEVFRQHLKERGFVVVAAGTHADGFTKVYIVGASRAPIRSETSQNTNTKSTSSSIYFLSEIKICRADESTEAYVVGTYGNGHIFVMDCIAKCTNEEYLPIFIAEFKFGSIYKLL